MLSASPIQSSSATVRVLLCFAMAVALFAASPGCRIGRPGEIALRGPRPEPALSYDISQSDLLAHLNQNADRVRSWISRDCQMLIRTPAGLPVRLKATIACEEPRNFRLVADGSLVVHADIGSNDSFCWWWMQPGENVLFRVPHTKLDYVRNHPLIQQVMSMPFEPDWLMEVLGVTRIASEGMTMHRDTNGERVNLVSEQHTEDGRMYRRITVVDLHAGNVCGHRIVDSANNTIARATLSDFEYQNGSKLPGKIEVDWPTMDMSLSITVRNLSVNTELQPNLWQPPAAKSMEVVDLAEHLRRLEQSGHQFKSMELTPGRPAERPVYDGNVQRASSTDDDIEWDEGPVPGAKPKRKWYQWPSFRR